MIMRGMENRQCVQLCSMVITIVHFGLFMYVSPAREERCLGWHGEKRVGALEDVAFEEFVVVRTCRCRWYSRLGRGA